MAITLLNLRDSLPDNGPPSDRHRADDAFDTGGTAKQVADHALGAVDHQGLGVVANRNLVRGAVWLMISLFGVAGYMVLLSAPFLASSALQHCTEQAEALRTAASDGASTVTIALPA